MADKLQEDEERSKVQDVMMLLEEEQPQTNPTQFFRKSNRNSARVRGIVTVACLVLFILLSFALGLLLGWVVFDEFRADTDTDSTAAFDWGDSVTVDGRQIPVGNYIRDNIDPENIKSNLRYLTLKPHIAGKARNSELAHTLYNQWTKYGFDSVDLSNYTVLLDYVDRSNYNVLTLRDSNSGTLYTANTTQEGPLVEEEDDPDVPPPFNAYSGVGSAQGALVYVNYGRIEDFMYLSSNLSLNLTGRICIARYGRIFRGNKAHLAQEYGCSGLIIFSDPFNYGPQGGGFSFPDGPFLPSTGLQRGSVMLFDGDPLTPGLPSIDDVARRSYEEAMAEGEVPSIPVQPISYGDALWFMSQLSVHPVPDGWQGGLDLTYHILQSEDNTNTTYIEVNNERTQAVINDVVGVIYGSIEPDHMVILGNHRDAWTFGAVDPNSGTAVLMELARILGEMRDKGWRPGRTIVLCSWDAEEYGLIGSTEWVEHYQKLLGASTVAYLNVDIAVEGQGNFAASASPLLFNVIYNVTKQISCPSNCNGAVTLYEKWEQGRFSTPTRPYIGSLGSGSDYTAFVQLIGISSANFVYISDEYNGYPVYHSVHDNFYWSSHFGDPDYIHHKTIGEVWSRVAMTLSTTPILPYDPTDYSERLQDMLNQLINNYGNELKQNNISLGLLENVIEVYSMAASNFKAVLQNYSNTQNDRVIRLLNKKLLNLERSFIQPQGLPGQPYHRHVISAPSTVNTYSSSSFPGVSDAIFDAINVSQDWAEVYRQISIVAVHIMYAAQILEQPDVEWLGHA